MGPGVRRHAHRARWQKVAAAMSSLEQDISVDIASIEKRLADLWRMEKKENNDDDAVTRAALWNVVAHSSNSNDNGHAAQVLGRASAAVPQRTIVVHADP